MSAKTRHNGLSADDRSDIRSTILQARKTLEEEFERQLERYGIYDDERVPVSSLSHLSVEDIATRKEIDAALERELEATDGIYGRAYQNYIREATKEYLNRLVGLKTIEARELVTETLRTRAEYGNRSYMHYTIDEIAGELTDTPDDGLGDALDLAYQEIGSEIQVLFDGSDYTALKPDFAVRREILEELDNLGDGIWSSDEAMGWVYQYFGENEREEIDERIDAENYKVQDTDVATKTQLFTPRYIVEWMVDNSLGRLWLEMHGDNTNIDDEDKCFYLAPLEESLIDRNVKDVREIKVLDPACGSGHMLFYAFDLLYEMYLEHSDVAEKHIPREILKNNLYGIDIDEGAAQIAALALYVKAKGHAPEVAIEGMNIVSANAVLINGEKKQEVLERADSELERRVLEQVWTSFEHIREWGSLVRIEEQIEEIIEEEIDEIKSTGQTQFTSDGLAKQSSVISYSGEEESWESVKDGLLDQVTELAEEALEQNDPVEEIFAGEVEKSVKILDLFIYDYDVVISNPPYLGSAKMGDVLKKYLKSNYKGNRGLSTAFIERCTEFSGRGKYVSMVTPENYMFIKSFRNIREYVVKKTQFIEGAHLSGHSFSTGDRPFTIPFVLRNDSPSSFRHSRFYRMTHEQQKYNNHEKKIEGLGEIAKSIRSGKEHPDVYVVDQNTLKDVKYNPIVYWFGNEILGLFSEYRRLEQFVNSQSGIKSGNNNQFLRKCWEVNSEKIGQRYRRFIRSENKSEYSDQISWVIDWKDDGEYIKKYCNENNHQFFFGDEDLLGEESVGFIDMSSTLTARNIQKGDLCSIQLFTIHAKEDINTDYLNGLLNSSLYKFIANGLNPSMHFKQNDVLRLPYISPTPEKEREIGNLVRRAIQTTEKRESLVESSLQFSPTEFMKQSTSIRNYLFKKDILDAELSIIKGVVDKSVFELCSLSNKTITDIYSDLPSNLFEYPHIEDVGSLAEITDLDTTEIKTIQHSDSDLNRVVNEIIGSEDKTIRHISEEFEISPFTEPV